MAVKAWFVLLFIYVWIYASFIVYKITSKEDIQIILTTRRKVLQSRIYGLLRSKFELLN